METKNEITVKVAPIIEYSAIEKIGKQVELKIAGFDLDNIEPTEENKTLLKNIRTELNAELKAYEDDRKNIKKAINEPYNKFEDAYKDNIKEKYSKAINKLKSVIDGIENDQKLSIKGEVFNYFLELTMGRPELKFITFDSLGLNITLSASLKSYKDKIKAVINQVINDLNIIKTQQHSDRLLVKYQKTRDLAGSIKELNDELAAEKIVPKETIEEKTIEPVVEDEDVFPIIEFKLFDVPRSKAIQIRTFIESLGVEYE